MADFGRLDGLLQAAAKLLDVAAAEIRDLDFENEKNIRKIGDVLAEIFDLQIEIYERRPDLRPEDLGPIQPPEPQVTPNADGPAGTVSRELAKKTISVAVECAGKLNAILVEIKNECSEEEFLKYRRGVGYVLGYLFTEIMRPLIQSYPELTPPQLTPDD